MIQRKLKKPPHEKNRKSHEMENKNHMSLRHSRKLEEVGLTEKTEIFNYNNTFGVDPELFTDLEDVYDVKDVRKLYGIVSEAANALFRDSFFDRGLIDIRPIAGKGLIRGPLSPSIFRPSKSIIDTAAQLGDLLLENSLRDAGLLRSEIHYRKLKENDEDILKELSSYSSSQEFLPNTDKINKLKEKITNLQASYNEKAYQLKKKRLDDLIQTTKIREAIDDVKEFVEKLTDNKNTGNIIKNLLPQLKLKVEMIVKSITEKIKNDLQNNNIVSVENVKISLQNMSIQIKRKINKIINEILYLSNNDVLIKINNYKRQILDVLNELREEIRNIIKNI